MLPPTRHLTFRRPDLRRWLCAGLLIVFGATAAGIPLPIGKPILSKSNELFPCAGSSCGCRTAHQCWHSCCCTTLAERLAWAKRHGVRPPAFAIAEARAAGIGMAWLKTGGPAATSCAASSCCQAKQATSTRSCCKRSDESGVARSCCQPREKAPQGTTVIGWRALKCDGKSIHWLCAVPTSINLQAGFLFDAAPIAWLCPMPPAAYHATAESPAVPPPELA
jgi:hypothetical protein